MKVAFYIQRDHHWDFTFAAHLFLGIRAHGDTVEARFTDELPDGGNTMPGDCAVLAGVKNDSPAIFRAYTGAGKHAIIIDKGYIRVKGGMLGTLYFRMSVDEFQPTGYMGRSPRPSKRWEAVKWLPLDGKIAPQWSHRARDGNGKYVVFCGGSQKYCDWHGLGDANGYAEKIIAEIRPYLKPSQEIVYRPKPTYKEARPIEGTLYSHGGKRQLGWYFHEAQCVVTFGSNAAVEAVANGIPAVVLGDGVAGAISSRDVSEINDPRLVPRDEVEQFFRDLAYCQFTLDEMKDGTAWKYLREEMAAK